MYLGQVSVAQEDLDSFLSVAQDLMIKGLTQNQDGGQGQNQSQSTSFSSSTPKPSTSASSQPPAKRLKMSKNGGEAVKTSVPKKAEIKADPDPVEVIEPEQDTMESYEDYYEAGPSESGEEGKGRDLLLNIAQWVIMPLSCA